MKALIVTLALAPTLLCAAPSLVKVATGLKKPVDFATAQGLDDVIFVAEQNGYIKAFNRENGAVIATVLDISDRVSRSHSEQGLLGLTFSPDFQKSHRFYVNYTDKSRKEHTKISRFVMDPKTLIADASEEEMLLKYKQDFKNHNGGWIAFGPDGYLYNSAGDGGAANDPKARAQDNSNLLGTLLRIDVSGAKGYTIPKDNPFVGMTKHRPEIYSYGLRNAWRCSFDKKTGDLWIADVGQNAWEEVNFVPQGAAKGKNFGWRLREGFHKTPKKGVGGDKPSSVIDPIYEYSHGGKTNQGLSITGGYVYHGSNPDLQKRYLFADYVTQRIWSITQEDGKLGEFQDHTNDLLPTKGALGKISSFGQDNQGEVYILDHSFGAVYRIK